MVFEVRMQRVFWELWRHGVGECAGDWFVGGEDFDLGG